jgi:hypothetical protein
MLEPTVAEVVESDYSFVEIFRRAWKAFTDSFSDMAIVAIVILLPINLLLTQLVASAYNWIDRDHLQIELSNRNVWLFIGVAICLVVVEAVVYSIGSLALVLIIDGKNRGESITIQEALMRTVRRLGAIFWTGLLTMVLILGLCLLLIIPGIVYGVYWQFAAYAVLLEQVSGKQALDMSKKIVTGRWLRVFIYGIGFSIVQSIIQRIGDSVWPVSDLTTVTGAVRNVAMSFINIFFWVVTIVFFLNLRATWKARQQVS